jgi:integrase
MRRSELVALDVADVTETNDGLIVTVTRSKTDQEGEGRQIGIPYGSNPTTCPVRTFDSWLDVSRIDDGPLFRPINRHGKLGDERLSDRAVAMIVKRAAEAAGLDPNVVAGHSLRSGMATSAARAGATEAQIMNQTCHKSLTVLRRYIRRGTLFSDNASAKLGL